MITRSKSLNLLGAFLFCGLFGGIYASQTEAATVQIRNKTSLPITIALRGTGTNQYSTDKLQPGSARVYKVQSDSPWAFLWVMPPGGSTWIRIDWLQDIKTYSIEGYHKSTLRVGGEVDPRFR